MPLTGQQQNIYRKATKALEEQRLMENYRRICDNAKVCYLCGDELIMHREKYKSIFSCITCDQDQITEPDYLD